MAAATHDEEGRCGAGCHPQSRHHQVRDVLAAPRPSRMTALLKFCVIRLEASFETVLVLMVYMHFFVLGLFNVSVVRIDRSKMCLKISIFWFAEYYLKFHLSFWLNQSQSVSELSELLLACFDEFS